MNYSLTFDRNENLITAEYDEQTSLQDRERVLLEIVNILKDCPNTNVLIDLRKSKRLLTKAEQLQFGELLASHKHYFTANKTAVLTRGGNPHPLIQTSAYFEGFETMVEFDNKTIALEWMRGRLR